MAHPRRGRVDGVQVTESDRTVPIVIEVDKAGLGRLIIDGVDIGHAVSSVRLVIKAGDVPTLELVAIPGSLVVSAEGVVSLVEE